MDTFKRKKGVGEGEMCGNRGLVHIYIFFYQLNKERFNAYLLKNIVKFFTIISQRVSLSNLSAHRGLTQSARSGRSGRRTVTKQKNA